MPDDIPTESGEPASPLHRAQGEPDALPAGSRLAQYEIQRVLGSGGFGIVYLALDHSLQRQVAIKEYLPAALAMRTADAEVGPRRASFAATYEAGRRSFVNEARLLARFDHPALVKVHHFWEANGTAYMVMPYYQGATLRQVRQSMSEPPDEAWLRRVLDALIGALNVLHSTSTYHRDVAPDNIVLPLSGMPVLLDFGAARHVLAGQAQPITAVVKPTYAPIEQYAAAHEFGQGPWTDIYATAATLHYCLTGNAPPTAAARAVHDTYRPLCQRAELAAPSRLPYDRRWLAALDWALAVKPADRPQTLAEWKEALHGKSAPKPALITDAQAQPARHSAQRAPLVTEPLEPKRSAPAPKPARAARQASSPRWLAGALATGAALLAGAALWSPPSPLSPAVQMALPSRQTTPVPTAVALSPVVAEQASPATPPAAALAAPAAAPAPPTRNDREYERLMARLAAAPSQEPATSPIAPPTRVAKRAHRVHLKTASAEAFTVGEAANKVPVVTARAQSASDKSGPPLSPRQACSSKSFFASFGCMSQTCAQPKWATHSQCEYWRQTDRRKLTQVN